MLADDTSDLAGALEAEFGVKIVCDQLLSARTAGDLHSLVVHAVEEQPASTSDSTELWERLQKLVGQKINCPTSQVDETTIVIEN